LKIAVASGKGGTGKTLVSTCLIRVMHNENLLLLDADVEEPNAALFLPGQLRDSKPVFRPIPQINQEKCTLCGTCADICNYNALVVTPSEVLVFPELCHSCGACAYLCPQDAIIENKHRIGIIETYVLEDGGVLKAGKLSIGEAQSPPLIKAVKDEATDEKIIITDCPPGTTCPMIEAIRDNDYCLLVTEPTPFGVHDLVWSLKATKMLNIPCGIIINRWQGDDAGIKDVADEYGASVIARIPYSWELARAYAHGENPLQVLPELKDTMEMVAKMIKEKV